MRSTKNKVLREFIEWLYLGAFHLYHFLYVTGGTAAYAVRRVYVAPVVDSKGIHVHSSVLKHLLNIIVNANCFFDLPNCKSFPLSNIT